LLGLVSSMAAFTAMPVKVQIIVNTRQIKVVG